MDNFDLKKYLAEGRLIKEDIDREIVSYIADTYIQNAKGGDRRYADFLDLNIRDAVQDVLGILQSSGHPLHDETKEEYSIVKRDKAKGLFEENQSPKFKIGDFVQPKVGSTMYFLRDRGTIKDKKKYIGQIENVFVNKPENLRTKDGEYLYAVKKLNHRGKDVMSFDFKESDLESIPNPTDYIQSLTPYKRRN